MRWATIQTFYVAIPRLVPCFRKPCACGRANFVLAFTTLRNRASAWCHGFVRPSRGRGGPGQTTGEARAQLEAATDAHKLAIGASAVSSVRRARLAAAGEWYVAQERFARASSRAGPDCLGGEKRLALEPLSEVETGWLERTGQLLLAAGQQDLSTQLELVRSQVEAARVQAAQTRKALETIPKAPLPLPEETQAELRRLGVACRQSLDAVAKRFAEDTGRADQVVAETRVALSEAQSTMIRLERASAVWKQYVTTLAEYEERGLAPAAI